MTGKWSEGESDVLITSVVLSSSCVRLTNFFLQINPVFSQKWKEFRLVRNFSV